MASNDALLEEGRQIFVEESRDLLRQMEDSLLRLETEPGDADAVNALFRAAHTIKGSAGLFGYDEIVAFTHTVESLLDQLRNLQVTLSAGRMSALLQSGDHMGVLVERVVRGQKDEDAAVSRNGADLLARLATFMPSESRVVPAAASAACATSAEAARDPRPAGQSDAWHISLRFGPNVLRNGMDPLSFIRYLGTLGEVGAVATVTDALPRGADFDPESCYLGFEIRLKSAADKKTIEDVFEFVRDDCTLHILPPNSRVQAYIELIDALPEAKERLGEIPRSGPSTSRRRTSSAIC